VVADWERPRGPGTVVAGADGVVVDSSVCPTAVRWAGDPEVADRVAALAAPAAASTTTATESNLRSPPDTNTGPLSRVAMARAERPLTVTDITGKVMSVTDIEQKRTAMRLFVTGASGWIGSATVAELVGAGHEVVGLARSDASAKKIESAGATPTLGDLNDPDGLAKTAAESDGVIHLAFQHEVAFGAGDFAAAAAVDRQAVEAMGSALAGSERPLVLASGLIGLSLGRPATEHDGLIASPQVRANPAGLRAATALLTLSLRGRGVRSSVLRYPPTVHGDGDKGFVATFAALARQAGFAAYVGDGANRWPAVHLTDAARVTRLAAELAPGGSVVHAVGEEGVPFRQIADAIGRHLDLPTKSLTPEEAVSHFGPLGHFVGMDSPADAAISRDLLGWAPTGPGLIEDLDMGHYFKQG
jgi:nucleoside-diphosphate-sugar epimerase